MNLPRQRFAGVLLLLLACCSSKTNEPADSDGSLDVSNVVFDGETTDEALLHLLDSPTKDDPRQYVEIDSPDLDAPLSKDSPASFEFHLASKAARVPVVRSTPAWQRSLREMLQLLGPVRVAHAHGAAFNGTAYFLVFTDADAKRQLRVFTDKTSYTPTAVAWEGLVQAKQPLTLEITSAFFELNEVAEEDGPFVGGRFELEIE